MYRDRGVALLLHHLDRGGGSVLAEMLLPHFVSTLGDRLKLVTVASNTADKFAEKWPLVHPSPTSTAGRLLWEQRSLPRILRRAGVESIVGLGNWPARLPSVPQLIYVQNAHFAYPVNGMWFQSRYRKIRIRLAQLRLERLLPDQCIVVVQTDIMMARMMAMYPHVKRINVLQTPLPRLDEIPIGQAQNAWASRPDDVGLRLFAPGLPYPHKNLSILVEVADILRIHGLKFTIGLTLPEGSTSSAKLLEAIRAAKLEDCFLNMGWLTHPSTLKTLENSTALLLPTVFETVCLPFLEARSCGTPIITSDLDFATAQCGPSAVYFNPRDAQSIADAVLSFAVTGAPRVPAQDEVDLARITPQEFARQMISFLDTIE